MNTDFTKMIAAALCEDRADSDLTTRSCIPEEAVSTAEIVAKSPCTICGLPLIPVVFAELGAPVAVELLVEEGATCKKGDRIARLEGKTRDILSAERVLLNTLQLATSVATKTARFVEEIAPYTCDILDTRKTFPGLRALQKYAVATGGGKNHRFHLAEKIMIKDNHLTHVAIGEAIAKARKLYPNVPVQVEVDTLDQLREVMHHPVDAILLDNMSPETIEQAVAIAGDHAYLEASGGIDLSNVRCYAKTGVHGISVGALTHTIDAVDLSLNM